MKAKAMKATVTKVEATKTTATEVKATKAKTTKATVTKVKTAKERKAMATHATGHHGERNEGVRARAHEEYSTSILKGASTLGSTPGPVSKCREAEPGGSTQGRAWQVVPVVVSWPWSK